MDPPGAREYHPTILGALMHKISLYEQDLSDEIKAVVSSPSKWGKTHTVKDILKAYPRKVSSKTGRLIITLDGDQYKLICYLYPDEINNELVHKDKNGTVHVQSPFIKRICHLYAVTVPVDSWMEDMTPDQLQLQNDGIFENWLKINKYWTEFTNEINRIHEQVSI